MVPCASDSTMDREQAMIDLKTLKRGDIVHGMYTGHSYLVVQPADAQDGPSVVRLFEVTNPEGMSLVGHIDLPALPEVKPT